MKYIVVIALVSALVACSGGSSNESITAAQSALNDLIKARTMLSSVHSVDDAQAIEVDLAEVGKSYAEAMQLMRTVDQTDQETAQTLAQLTPKIAVEYQAMLMQLNALQSRNSKAAQILLDELKAFKY
jgi:hypothetical protein